MPKLKQKITPTREPNGRLSRSTERALDACAPAEARRLRDASLAGMRDPTWGSEIGRLFLAKKLTEAQFEAGRRWGRLTMAYHQAMGSPAPFPVGISLGGRSSCQAADPDSDEGRRQAEIDAAIISEWKSAHDALCVAARADGAARQGEVLAASRTEAPSAARAVRATCEVNEIPVGAEGLLLLRIGLDKLALHLGLVRI